MALKSTPRCFATCLACRPSVNLKGKRAGVMRIQYASTASTGSLSKTF